MLKIDTVTDVEAVVSHRKYETCKCLTTDRTVGYTLVQLKENTDEKFWSELKKSNYFGFICLEILSIPVLMFLNADKNSNKYTSLIRAWVEARVEGGVR